MNEWALAEDHHGYRVKTLQHGSCTIEIYRPILSSADQTKQENLVKEAMERALYGYVIRKEKKDHEQHHH